jgi:glycosyltransferase 2 family protein
MTETKKRYLNLAKGALSLGLLVVLISRIQAGKTIIVLRTSDLRYLIAGLILAPGIIPCLAMRVREILKKGKLDIPFRMALQITWIGQFWNFFLPGSTGGDIYRMTKIWECHPDKKPETFVAVAADRIIASTLLIAAAVLSCFFVPYRGSLFGKAIADRSFLGIALVAVLTVAAVAILGIFTPSGRNLFGHRWGELRARLLATRCFFRSDVHLFAAILLAAIGYILNFIVFYCFCKALHFDITFTKVALLLPPIWLLLMIPVSINGHGVREVLFIYFFTVLQIKTPEGLIESVVALSIIGLSSDLFWGIPGGVMYFWTRVFGDRRGQIRSSTELTLPSLASVKRSREIDLP